MQYIKLVLYSFSVVFWVMGAVMLGVGIWLAVDPWALEALGEAERAGVESDLWVFAVYAFITVGAIGFILGFLGICGACDSEFISCSLWMYSFLVGPTLLIEIVIVIATAIVWSSVDEDVAQMMQSDVKIYYINETSSDGYSSAWNTMQQQWKCCGSYNYRDYNGSFYDRDNNDNNTNTYVPYTCCKDISDLTERPYCQQGIEENLHIKGCYDALKEFLDEITPIIIGITCTFAVLQFVGLILACCLIHQKPSSVKSI